MISDEELKEALELYERTRPTPELVALERKCRRLRIGYLSKLWARRTAIVIVLVFGLSLISPQVRAAVSGWIARISENESVYISGGKKAPLGSGDYELTWIPEDCQLIEVTDAIDGKTFWYVDSEGYNLFFTYIHNLENGQSKSWMDVGSAELQKVTVNGQLADLYIDKNDEALLVWLSEDEGTLFQLQGHYIVDLLVKMAESVR